MIRLLIADDHKLFRQGLRQLLVDQLDMDVVGEACNAEETLTSLRGNGVDVAILDLSMREHDGLDLIRQVKRLRPALPVLVLTMHDHEQYALQALKVGASGFVTKDCAAEQVVAAIRKLANGGEYISPNVAERLALSLTRSPDASRPHDKLTGREFEVFELLIAGRNGTQIAAELSLSKKTVSTHKMRVLKKLNVRNEYELARYALENQLGLPTARLNPGAASTTETVRDPKNRRAADHLPAQLEKPR